MNGNPLYEQLNHAHERLQNAKDLQTVNEHMGIIQKYRASRTGHLDEQDRQDALEKWRKFNEEHHDYCISINTQAAMAGNCMIPPEAATDIVIVNNLCDQMMYLVKQNARKEWAQWILKNWN